MQQVRQLLSLAPSEDALREVRDSCRRHLGVILGNIAAHPSELKFRRIREENAILKAQLFAFPRAADLLEIAGFEHAGAGATGAWVFMHAPEDEAAMGVLRGVLAAVTGFTDDAAAAAPEQAGALAGFSSRSIADVAESAVTATTAAVSAAAAAAFAAPAGRQHQASTATTTDGDDDPHQQQQQLELAPKYFSFAKSLGFQMRMEALREVVERGCAADVHAFVVGLLTDPRNAGVVHECVRIVRVLLANMEQEPAAAKFRLLKFDNAVLSKNFFPVAGAAELFIGVLGFSVCDDGIAMAVPARVVPLDGDGLADSACADTDEAARFATARRLLALVDDALQRRRELENDERRRAGSAELGALMEAERRRQRGGGPAPASAPAPGSAPAAAAAASVAPARRRVPIAEAMAMLLGRDPDAAP